MSLMVTRLTIGTTSGQLFSIQHNSYSTKNIFLILNFLIVDLGNQFVQTNNHRL